MGLFSHVRAVRMQLQYGQALSVGKLKRDPGFQQINEVDAFDSGAQGDLSIV